MYVLYLYIHLLNAYCCHAHWVSYEREVSKTSKNCENSVFQPMRPCNRISGVLGWSILPNCDISLRWSEISVNNDLPTAVTYELIYKCTVCTCTYTHAHVYKLILTISFSFNGNTSAWNLSSYLTGTFLLWRTHLIIMSTYKSTYSPIITHTLVTHSLKTLLYH